MRVQLWDDWFTERTNYKLPALIKINIRVHTTYNASIRYIFLAPINVYVNNKQAIIGSVCGKTAAQILALSSTDMTSAEKCAQGSLIPPSAIAPMETEVGALDAVTFRFPEIKDTGSSLNGDATGLTNCGPRIYTLLNGGTFLTMSGRDLTLQTNNPLDVRSQYPVKVKVTLAQYP